MVGTSREMVADMNCEGKELSPARYCAQATAHICARFQSQCEDSVYMSRLPVGPLVLQVRH